MTFEEMLRHILREEIRAALRDQFAEEPLGVTLASGWLTIAQAAAHASVHSATIRAWIKGGELPASKRGRVVRVKRDDLDALLSRAPASPAAVFDIKRSVASWRKPPR